MANVCASPPVKHNLNSCFFSRSWNMCKWTPPHVPYHINPPLSHFGSGWISFHDKGLELKKKKKDILTKLLHKIMPSTSKGELVPKFITYLAPRCSWFISIIYLPWSKMLTQMSLSKFEKRCCFSCTSCLPLSSNVRWKT